jgi:hypothetical protein
MFAQGQLTATGATINFSRLMESINVSSWLRPACALGSILLLLFNVPLQAAVTPIDPFSGTLSETFESYTYQGWQGGHLASIMGGGASIANGTANALLIYFSGTVSGGTSGMFLVSDGTKGAQETTPTTITFNTPVFSFGGDWATFTYTGHDPNPIYFDFYDEFGVRIDGLNFSYSHNTTADGGLDWHGWSSPVGIKAVVVRTTCGLFVFDGLQAVPGGGESSPPEYTFTTLPGLAGTPMAVDWAGNVYVSDDFTIRRVTADEVVTTLAGRAGTQGSVDGVGSSALFSGANGMALDNAGNIYVADDETIREVTPAGLMTTLAGQAGNYGSADGIRSAAQFKAAIGAAVDSDGNVFVTDYYAQTIRKLTPGGVVTTFAGLADNYGPVDGIGNAARF